MAWIGYSGFTKVRVGSWRKGVVQVVSGRIGKEKVHFEGPPHEHVDREMGKFFKWLNQEDKLDYVLKSAIAHLWFVTIHPFDDGNGRIARAIADLLLARSESSPQRFYSLSSQIQKKRKDYYAILEKTQKGTLDITPWINWFLGCLGRAIENSVLTLDKIVTKSRVWQKMATVFLKDRQKKIINRLLDGFDGKLTTSKWAKIAKCSQDTAYRDIIDLLEKGILIKNSGGGRSTSYALHLSAFEL